uniref:SWIM-type domain-containing protein n=1 Tax=Nicotiana tabacum TaxID=4097 RepID=A0A1S3ZBP6_TOBAC|nr:PREDICTED: uncharacterized protein LOC107785119 [Nicotiana tabacum]
MHPKCPWILAASKDDRSNNFKVKRYCPVHKCYKTNKNKLCNSIYLAKHYRDKIVCQPNMKVWELKKLIKDELDIYVGRSTIHGARAKILKEIIGDVHAEFKRLFDYRDILLQTIQTNPGTTCVVKVEDQGEGKLVFNSFYVCFYAMKKGWPEGCRRIIGLDGCFLKGICKGQLLVAVSKDGNNQMFPIAWAIVEVENSFTWTWFLKCVTHDLELQDGRDLTIMSDMQKGLLKVVSEVLPESEHRWCARHILANWSKDWRGLERRNNFWRCVRASCVAELNFHLDSLNMLGNGICESLLRKCDIIDNNMCETFNAWILAARHKTIITMLEEIKVKMMERIGNLREFADTWICDITPISMKVYHDNMTQSIRCTIKWNGEYGYEVEDTSLRVVLKHCVNMQAQTCTCRSWMLKGIPCAHAIAAIHFKNLDPINYISHWYHKSTYLKAYSTFIQPVSNMQMWPM